MMLTTWLPDLVMHAEPQAWAIYLTFDDGPTTKEPAKKGDPLKGPTITVLDILKENDVPATFFLHGRAINEWSGPAMVRMIAEGHAIGNHLWRQGGNTVTDKSPLALLAQQYIVAEKRIRAMLQATDVDAYNKYLAQPKLFRRPGGNNGLTGYLDPKNYDMLSHEPYLRPYLDQLPWLKEVYDYSGWQVVTGDGIAETKVQPKSADDEVHRILKGGYGDYGVDDFLCVGKPPRRSLEATAGLVTLMHDADALTDKALPEIISQLKDRGAEFRALPRPGDKPNASTVGIGYAPTVDPNGVAC